MYIRKAGQTEFSERNGFALEGDAQLLGDAFVVPRSSREFLRLNLYAFLIALDCLLIAASFVLASQIRFATPLATPALEMLLVVLPVYVAIAVNGGAYSLETLKSASHAAKAALKSLLFALAAVIGVLFYMKSSAEFSRLVTGIASVVAIFALTAGRYGAIKAIGRRLGWRYTTEVLLIDGVPLVPTEGQIVLFADKMNLQPTRDNPELLNRFGALLKGCDRVVVSCPAGRRRAWAKMLKGINTVVEIVVPEVDQMGALALGKVGSSSTLVVGRGPLALRQRVTKRLFDLAVTVPALLALFPVYVAVALTIKLETKGPVFFKQPRVGRDNRQFQVLKFRSMRTDAEDVLGNRSAARNDDRVTKVGGFLRRTSLDELPQLLNVVKGEMSLVGPRPHALGSTAGEELFWHADDKYWDRHAVKPGITGLAQVRGHRGATHSRDDLTRRVQADLEYLSDWSLWKDVKILASTVRVLRHGNAY